MKLNLKYVLCIFLMFVLAGYLDATEKDSRYLLLKIQCDAFEDLVFCPIDDMGIFNKGFDGTISDSTGCGSESQNIGIKVSGVLHGNFKLKNLEIAVVAYEGWIREYYVDPDNNIQKVIRPNIIKHEAVVDSFELSNDDWVFLEGFDIKISIKLIENKLSLIKEIVESNARANQSRVCH